MKRNINVDILRIIAFFFVILVHSLKYTDFYNTINNSKTMILTNIIRVLLMSCVPLFIVISGYLMNKKKICKEYYLKLFKYYFLVYLLCSIFSLIVRHFLLYEVSGLGNYILEILDFKAAPYSWYFEMYIGLYLIIPFLNILWNGIKKKNHKKVLIAVLIFSYVVPSICNIKYSIIPDYWFGATYPILYYFIGCYIKDYLPRIKISKLIISLVIIILCGIFNFYKSYNGVFVSAIYNNHYSLGPFLATIIITIIILNIKISLKNEKIIRFISKISYLTFGAYLVSYVYDKYIYSILDKYTSSFYDRFFLIIPITIIIVLLSLMTSFFIDKIYTILKLIISKVVVSLQKRVKYNDI